MGDMGVTSPDGGTRVVRQDLHHEAGSGDAPPRIAKVGHPYADRAAEQF
jgi:hypothetical protein